MTMDCADVEVMADFWQEALGYEQRRVEEPS